ncbi:unnamed protein product [Closterium sp. NIES-54]
MASESDYPSYFNNAFSFWKCLDSNKPTKPSLQPRSSSNASKLRQVSSLSLTPCCSEASDAVLSCADTNTESVGDASRSEACLVDAAASLTHDSPTWDPTASASSSPDPVAYVPAVTSEPMMSEPMTSEPEISEPATSEPLTCESVLSESVTSQSASSLPPAEDSLAAVAAGLGKATTSSVPTPHLVPSRIPKPSGQRSIVKSRVEGTTLIPRPAAAERQVRSRRSSNGAKQLDDKSVAIPAAAVKKVRAVSSSKVVLAASSRRPWRP